MSSGNDKVSNFKSNTVLKENSDKSANRFFATAQYTLLTLWYPVPTTSRASKPPEAFLDEYIPIVTLDVEFEILGIELASDASCLVVVGSSPLVLIWRLELSVDNLFSVFQGNSAINLFQNSQFNAYNSQLTHPHINVYDLIELPEFQDLYFCDLRELIKTCPNPPILSPSPRFNFARLLNQPQGLVLALGGPGNHAIFQISLSFSHSLTSINTGLEHEVSCVGLNCDNSLFAAMTTKNELILIDPITNSSNKIPLLSETFQTSFDPITHLTFSNFEPEQLVVSYRSGLLSVLSISFPEYTSIANAQISVILRSSPCYSSWQRIPLASPMAFTPLNRYLLASITPDNRLITYDVVKRREVKELPLGYVPASVVFGANGTTVMVGSNKGTLELYDLLGETKPIWFLRPESDSSQTPVNVIAFQKPVLRDHVTSKANHPNQGLRRTLTSTVDMIGHRSKPRKGRLANRPSSFGFDFETSSSIPLPPDMRSQKDLSYQLHRSLALSSPVSSPRNNFRDTSYGQEESMNNESPPYIKSNNHSRRGSLQYDSRDSAENTPRANPYLATPSSSNTSRERSYTLPSQKREVTSAAYPLNYNGINNNYDTRERSFSNNGTQRDVTKPVINTGMSSIPPDALVDSPTHSHRDSISNTKSLLDTKSFTKIVDDIVEDKIHNLRINVKNDIQDVHVELLAQFQKLKDDMEKMIKDSARVPELLNYIQTLEEENQRLKLDY